MSTLGKWGLLGGVVVLVLLPGPANAQEEPAAAVAEAQVEVTMAAGGSDAVEATYTVQATGDEIGDIEHLVVLRPGADVENLAVSGDVQGQPVPQGGEGVARFVLSAPGANATYTLSYQVTRDAGVFAVPLVIPNLPADAAARNVAITTRLPAGQELTGEVFPAVNRVEAGGPLLTTRVISPPSVVIAEYGGGGGISLSTWITAVTIVIFVAVAIGWYRSGATESKRAKERAKEEAIA